MYQENPVYYLKCMYGMLSFNREPWIIFDTEKKGETYQQQCNDGGGWKRQRRDFPKISQYVTVTYLARAERALRNDYKGRLSFALTSPRCWRTGLSRNI